VGSGIFQTGNLGFILVLEALTRSEELCYSLFPRV
jgi:hypothetical protein